MALQWTNEAELDLKACFELTDWSVFEAVANNLDEFTETVTSSISFCEDMCIPTRTHLTYNNDKPWFTTNSDSPIKSSQVTFIYIALLTIQIVTKQLLNIKIGKLCQ